MMNDKSKSRNSKIPFIALAVISCLMIMLLVPVITGQNPIVFSLFLLGIVLVCGIVSFLTYWISLSDKLSSNVVAVAAFSVLAVVATIFIAWMATELFQENMSPWITLDW